MMVRGTNGNGLRLPNWLLVVVPIVATLIWFGVRLGQAVQAHVEEGRVTRELICQLQYQNPTARPLWGPCRLNGGGKP